MQVRIYKPTKSTMQSSDGNNNWFMEFVKKPNAKFQEQLMHRVSSYDTSNELRLYFNTLDEAIHFAQKQSYSYEVIQPKKARIPKKSYASNFK